ncbi:MAG: sel1 repeat family protein [Desulfovibrio sp.]|jgi:TPR repeat protein|nr:sel1 repeat family protein [Desulfovibrio sp.]
METIKNSWSRFAFLVFFLACHASPGFAAPEARPEAGQANAVQTDGQRTISAEALFASLLVNAEKGQGQAMLNLGRLYEEGVGVPRNFTKALEWYQKAADAGVKEAYMRLGLCREIGMGATADMGKAVAAFEKAAALSHAPAQHKLAGLYLQGRGLPRDESKGFALLTQAADAGETAALFDLGVILRDGLFGRKADPEKARARFLKAAEAGHAGAVLAYASMCREGVGGKADPEGALAWLLALRNAGAQGPGLDEAIAELKGKLSPQQAAAAEKDAGRRLAAWNKIRGRQ